MSRSNINITYGELILNIAYFFRDTGGIRYWFFEKKFIENISTILSNSGFSISNCNLYDYNILVEENTYRISYIDLILRRYEYTKRKSVQNALYTIDLIRNRVYYNL